jgi:hypothetical protein
VRGDTSGLMDAYVNRGGCPAVMRACKTIV